MHTINLQLNWQQTVWKIQRNTLPWCTQRSVWRPSHPQFLNLFLGRYWLGWTTTPGWCILCYEIFFWQAAQGLTAPTLPVGYKIIISYVKTLLILVWNITAIKKKVQLTVIYLDWETNNKCSNCWTTRDNALSMQGFISSKMSNMKGSMSPWTSGGSWPVRKGCIMGVSKSVVWSAAMEMTGSCWGLSEGKNNDVTNL